jgi:hypothetical protein
VGALIIEFIINVKDKETNIKIIKALVSFLLIYVVITLGLSSGVKQTGLNENGLKNTFPLYKFVIGLNPKTNGGYSEEDADKLTAVKDPELRDKMSIRLIKKRLSSPKGLARLIIAKQVVMWAGLDNSTEWGFSYLKDTDVYILGMNISYDFFIHFLEKTEKSFYIILLLMAIFGILYVYKTRKNTYGINIISLTILLNFVVYSLIEIQTRYRDFQMIFMFIIASIGIEAIENFFIKHKRTFPELHSKNV